MMAAGFAESYIRLWSLKGEKLRGLRSDFSSSAIRDCQSGSSHHLKANEDSAYSCIPSKNTREKGQHHPQAHRP